MTDTAPGGPTAPSGMAARAIDFVVAALAVVAGLLLFGLAGLVTVDVLGRLPARLGDTWIFTTAIPALFGPVNPNDLAFTLPWTTEVTEYALYWLTFLGAPWVLREGGHIGIDILTQRLGPAARAQLARFVSLLGAAISAVLLYYGVAVMRKAFVEDTLIVRTLTVNEWWMFAPLPASAALLLMIYLRWLAYPPAPREGLREGP